MEVLPIRIEELFEVIDSLGNSKIEYDDVMIRQMVESIMVISKNRIKIIFRIGIEMDIDIEDGPGYV